MDDLIKFPAGTLARCNRNCPGAQKLPRAIEGMRENSNAYRLRDMCVLPDCGHLDAHWVFLSDNPQMQNTAQECRNTDCGYKWNESTIRAFCPRCGCSMAKAREPYQAPF